MNKVLFSNKSDNWQTPYEIYNHFINELKYIDPCPYLSIEDNLNKKYNKKLFINPPYSKIKEWIKFIKNNIYECGTIYLLIPSRTDTKYFYELMNTPYYKKIYFIKGRLKFSNRKSAPFPNILIKIEENKEIELNNFASAETITKEEILKLK